MQGETILVDICLRLDHLCPSGFFLGRFGAHGCVRRGLCLNALHGISILIVVIVLDVVKLREKLSIGSFEGGILVLDASLSDDLFGQ